MTVPARPRALVLSALAQGTGCGLRAEYFARALRRLGWDATLALPEGPPLPWSAEFLTGLPRLAAAGWGRFDLAVGIKPYPDVWTGLAVARWRGALTVVDVDDIDGGYRGGLAGVLGSALQAPALVTAALASTHHPLLRQRLVRRWGGERILDLPQGVDLDIFDPARLAPRSRAWRKARGLVGRTVLAFTAHLNVACQLELLLEVCGPWLRKHPRAVLVVAGGGPDLERFRALAAPMGRQVRFEGSVDPLEAAQALAASDVSVSVYGPGEGNRYRVPMKVAESLALGRPVVSNLIPGLAPLAPYLVEAAPEASQFARGLDRALRQGRARAISGRAYVRRHLDWTRVAADFLAQARRVHPRLPKAPQENDC